MDCRSKHCRTESCLGVCFRTFLWVGLLLALVAPLTPAGQDPETLTAEQIEKIENLVTTEMARNNIPGLSIAVVTDNQLSYAKGFGLADGNKSIPAEATTVYRTASLAKPITAVAAMQLVEQGKIDLDAPVQIYCPAFPEKPWPITIRQLLGHLGGVRHYQGKEVWNNHHYEKLVDTLGIFKNDKLLHQPGTKFHYSTYGYNLVGCAVEGASGKTYADYVHQNIFQPAGMEQTCVDEANAKIDNRAQGYVLTENRKLINSTRVDTSSKTPGGGLVSSVVDLAKFAIAVQTGKLVSWQTLEQMWTNQRTKNGKETPYGLGWQVTQRNGVRIVFHTGQQPEVSTFLLMAPERGYAVVLMSNLEQIADTSLLEIVRKVNEIVLNLN